MKTYFSYTLCCESFKIFTENCHDISPSPTTYPAPDVVGPQNYHVQSHIQISHTYHVILICWSCTRPYEAVFWNVGSAEDIFGLQWFEPHRTCINGRRWGSRCFQCGCHDLVLGVYVGDPIRDHIGCVYFPPFRNRIQVSTILDGTLQRNVDISTRRCSTATVSISFWVAHRFWNCDGKNNQHNIRRWQAVCVHDLMNDCQTNQFIFF